jgi:hypothetical protein
MRPRDFIAMLESWIFRPGRHPEGYLTRLKVKGQIANVGFEAFSSTPEELGESVKAQLAKSAKMIKDAGIEPE